MKIIIFYILLLLVVPKLSYAQSTVSYQYDNLNQLISVVYPGGVTVRYTYDALGNRTSKRVLAKVENIIDGTEAKIAYWFDNDPRLNTVDVNVCGAKSFDVDVSELSEAFHMLHVMARDNNGQWGAPVSYWFLNSRSTDKLQLAYWYDSTSDIKYASVSANGTSSFSADVSGLNEGMHVLHVMTQTKDGNWGTPTNHFFCNVMRTTKTKAIYWFDDETARKTAELKTGTMSLDVAHLQDGVHTLNLAFLDKTDALVSFQTSLFMKSPVGVAKGECWFDNDRTRVYSLSQLSGNHTFDISHLSNGMHTLYIRRADQHGDGSVIARQFYKSNVMEDTRLCYWFDDQAQDKHSLAATGGEYQVDVSMLSGGTHIAHFVLMNSEGIILGSWDSEFTCSDITDNTTDIGEDTDTELQYYDLSGIRLSAPTPGTPYIIVKKGKSGVLSVRKML